jgi:magnesium transporter
MSAVFEKLELEVRERLEAGDLDSLKNLLAEIPPADIADVLEVLDDEDTLCVFRLLSPEAAAEVLSETGSLATRELLMQLSPEEVGDLLDQMPTDDAVEILTADVPERQEELLAAMEPEDAAEVRDLLQYPPNSAGRLMTEKYVHVRGEMTAGQTLEHLRKVDSEVETVNDLYVLEPRTKKLIGVISLREVVIAPPQSRLDTLMETDVIAVRPEVDQEEVAQLVARYNFLAIPVTTEEGRMLGIVTVDDVIDVLVQENTEDALRFGGVEGGGAILDQPYFTIPIPTVIRRRAGWLLLLFVAETFTGSVLRVFEHELAQVVALSFFIPLLIGTGGNTGAQTVSTIIRGIALREIRLRDAWRVILRELSSGFLLGAVLGIFGFGRALLWGSGIQFSLVIGLSVLAICAWANTIGSLIPLVAHRLRIDPAIVSAPLITTLVDATGLFIYLTIARVLLDL